MKSFDELANSIKFNNRKEISVYEKDDDLELVGVGRSAAVFKVKSTKLALKVFFPQYTHLAKEEANIYRMLHGIPYYPTLHEEGSNYIVIDYIDGMTLYRCLNQGVKVSEEVINEVDHAIKLAKQRGLNPADVHLKNIFITTEKTVMIVDVVRFKQKEQCPKWKDLKKAYYKYYRRGLLPKKMPAILLNMIGNIYRKIK
ncbi:protein kinase family protein [Alkalihalobacillus sp. BA299]|uniref:protein kinase family protein n=1 Tax=Alkalihalobacillus sp. BA299 TaxID=2815938 RepID=UPI001ADA5BD3|nr:protein kinase family protein [Alkalihalobacillus sp. BA299]